VDYFDERGGYRVRDKVDTATSLLSRRNRNKTFAVGELCSSVTTLIGLRIARVDHATRPSNGCLFYVARDSSLNGDPCVIDPCEIFIALNYTSARDAYNVVTRQECIRDTSST